jgi:hypothetical protein
MAKKTRRWEERLWKTACILCWYGENDTGPLNYQLIDLWAKFSLKQFLFKIIINDYHYFLWFSFFFFREKKKNWRILIGGHCCCISFSEPVMGRGRSRPQRNLLTRMDEVTRGPMSVLRNCMINKTRVKVRYYSDNKFFFFFVCVCSFFWFE